MFPLICSCTVLLCSSSVSHRSHRSHECQVYIYTCYQSNCSLTASRHSTLFTANCFDANTDCCCWDVRTTMSNIKLEQSWTTEEHHYKPWHCLYYRVVFHSDLQLPVDIATLNISSSTNFLLTSLDQQGDSWGTAIACKAWLMWHETDEGLKGNTHPHHMTSKHIHTPLSPESKAVIISLAPRIWHPNYCTLTTSCIFYLHIHQNHRFIRQAGLIVLPWQYTQSLYRLCPVNRSDIQQTPLWVTILGHTCLLLYITASFYKLHN